MAEAKTKVNDASVKKFLASENETRRADCEAIQSLMEKITKAPAKMWGDAIVGFGTFTMTYANGKTGDWPLAAFSPRKQNLTIYIGSGFDGYDELLAKLGKHKASKACLYINSLADIDMKVLEKLVKASVKYTKEQHTNC